MGNLSAEWSDCLKLFFFFSVSRVCYAKKICKPEKLKTSICIILFFSAPLFELAQDEVVKEKALEAAKQFFTNSNITINLLPALIAGALLLLLGLPLIALLFQVIFLY